MRRCAKLQSMRPRQRAKVILRHAENYDVQHLRRLTNEALRELDLNPSGRTLLKPNVVVAGELFENAYTRPEFVEGILLALRDRGGSAISELAVGERCGITIPTRYAFREARYTQMLRRNKVKHYYFEETPQVEIPLTHAGRLRDSLYTPEPIAKADFFVNCPKFKTHPWTTVTFSLKNYIGIQDDRHRLIDHDFALDRKVADLQHVIQPEFIAIDCIIAGEGRMLTPLPRTMNLAIFGDNQVAVDAVCSRMLGLDPLEIPHIRLSHEDGFGPVDPDQIEILGDVRFEEAKERAEGYQVGLVRVEKYFEGSRISAYAGKPPGADYCWGGCPGALEEAIEIVRLYDEQAEQKMPRMHLVFGDYRGPLDISYGEKVVFVGDCVNYDGQLGGQFVNIESLYRERKERDPHQARHDDIYAKLLKVVKKVRAARNRPYLRLEGCPVSVAELVLTLSELGNVKNPYFDRRSAVSFNRSYLAWRTASLSQRLRGQPYQVQGPAERGNAQPEK